MTINKIINAVDPRTMHNAVMNKMDNVAIQQRSVAGNVFIKAPSLVGLSIAAVISNVTATAAEAFSLLGKLSLATVKYGVMKPIRAFLWNNAFEATMAKMPNGQSLKASIVRTGALALGIIYSATGLLFPTFNLRRQEELGNFTNQRKEAEARQVLKNKEAAEAQKNLEANEANEAKKALEANEKKLQEEKSAEELASAQAEFRKNFGAPVAKQAAAMARGEFAIGKAWQYKKDLSIEREQVKAWNLPALKQAAAEGARQRVLVDERLADIAYLEQFAVAQEKLGDRQRYTKVGYPQDNAAYERFEDIQDLEALANVEVAKDYLSNSAAFVKGLRKDADQRPEIADSAASAARFMAAHRDSKNLAKVEETQTEKFSGIKEAARRDMAGKVLQKSMKLTPVPALPVIPKTAVVQPSFFQKYMWNPLAAAAKAVGVN